MFYVHFVLFVLIDTTAADEGTGFILRLVLISVFLRLCACGLGVFCASQATGCLGPRIGRPHTS